VVAVAEPWGEIGRRKQQAGFELIYDAKYLAIYRLRGREIEVKGEGDWALVGREVAMAYLKPEFNWQTVRARLGMIDRKGANTIIGDLNCSARKRGKLQEYMEEEEMMDISTAEYTHIWGEHRCTIDVVITRGAARPWAIPEHWDHSADHAVVGARIVMQHRIKKFRRIDWEKMKEYVEKEEECRTTEIGEAYQMLVTKMKEEWTREVIIVGQSKPWWKAEWKELRKKARKSKEARRQLRREIRAAKREMWENWVQEGRDAWRIVQMCKNPFNNRARCRVLRDDEGTYE